MTNVKFSRKEIEKHIKLTNEVIEKITMFGTPVERVDDNDLEIEICANRPDLISMHGFLRGFKGFLGKEVGLKKYKLRKPEKDYRVAASNAAASTTRSQNKLQGPYCVKIMPSVKDVRPFTVCAIVRNIDWTDSHIKEIIDLQEKLHFTVGRNRKKVAIGIYPLEKIKLPIKFEAREPKDIKFIPLGEEREMDGWQILQKHPTGREFAHLLDGKEKFPVFCDASGKILSMPPIINSEETGKVCLETRDVFIECSGEHFETLKKVLNIIVTTLADMGGEIYQMELDYSGKKIITPDLTPDKMSFKVENVNKLIGLNLKEKEMQHLLEKMGYGFLGKKVLVPAWRTDVLHEVDLIEDIAIAYGYDKLEPQIPQVSTIGEESLDEKLKDRIADVLTGLGMNEVLTYHLIKQNEAEIMNLQNKVELENSKTDYKILRRDLLTCLMRILSENKDNEYPQNIFEMGTVFKLDTKQESETGIIEKENLAVALAPGNFTKAKEILNYLFGVLGVEWEIKEGTKEGLIEGRTGEIRVRDSKIGYIGELHPELLRAWGMKMPISIFEISLGKIFEGMK